MLTAGYTGDGLRAWKQNANGRTYFLYDGNLPMAELDSSGSLTATNSFANNGLVTRREGSTSIFYSFDSVRIGLAVREWLRVRRRYAS
ncbi:MAG TPA: hypothetical protein DCK93_10125 [Blastocatellia bacterium]|nr:hypothetical protein [Blastocatellia bacterium]HAF23247.1 hypothetical protein [Blastocatellia bacterium]